MNTVNKAKNIQNINIIRMQYKWKKYALITGPLRTSNDNLLWWTELYELYFLYFQLSIVNKDHASSFGSRFFHLLPRLVFDIQNIIDHGKV